LREDGNKNKMYLLQVGGDGYESGPSYLALMSGTGDLALLAREFETEHSLPTYSIREALYDSDVNIDLDERFRIQNERADEVAKSIQVIAGLEIHALDVPTAFVHWLRLKHGFEHHAPEVWSMSRYTHSDETLRPLVRGPDNPTNRSFSFDSSVILSEIYPPEESK